MSKIRKKYGKKFCKYCANKVETVDYKDLSSIKFALSERFKIMPRRLTGTCKRHQEILEKAIKRSRQAAFIPYVVDRNNVVSSPFDLIK
ncbi:MAG: 30S ribosomal protein S18 [uncultured Campylobacterales bacterium]|uniref:Small ribosomal subunit protein bS18 n=1 Tax=uncultured Campylobacterales bacterium TaxID=352960 RepID=A0A6S6SP39_9BACT|nr:MAG: 30S ribosomal protein S18 [uncultured Campylobacterales bacterium]